jgi:hypothetical protein
MRGQYKCGLQEVGYHSTGSIKPSGLEKRPVRNVLEGTHKSWAPYFPGRLNFISESSVRYLHPVDLMAPRIFKWLLDFCKTCVPLFVNKGMMIWIPYKQTICWRNYCQLILRKAVIHVVSLPLTLQSVLELEVGNHLERDIFVRG